MELRFADDIISFASQRGDIAKMLCHLSECCAKFGLEINFDKTKVMTWSSLAGRSASVTVGRQDVKIICELGSEKYLGRKITLLNPHEVELSSRLSAGWAAFHKCKAELCSGAHCVKDRTRLFDVVVTSVVLYGRSVWALKKSE